MSIGGISASSLFNLNTGSLQSTQQKQQQSFQTLAQQLQSGELTATQQNVSALQQEFLQAGTSTSAPGINSTNPNLASSGQTNGSSNTQAHFHHRFRVRVDAGSENSPDSSSNEAQPLQSTTASAAQAAYSSLSQDLQQVALNSDLITAQSALLQSPTGVSLTA